MTQRSDDVPSESAISPRPPTENPPYPRGGRKAYVVWGTALAAYVFAVTCRSSLSAMGIATAEHFGASSVTLSLFLYLQIFVYGLM